MIRQDILCVWFGLPAGAWPPDHYRLLGVRPGESDTQLIEQRAQQRMEQLRCYQMLHPEQASEGMNRLAEALICLTDPGSKREYDNALLGRNSDTVIDRLSQHDTWVGKPPPPLAPAAPAQPAPPQPPPLPSWYRETHTQIPISTFADTIEDLPSQEKALVAATKAPEEPAAPIESRERPDPILEAARSSVAWRGLGTCFALRRRITLTSKLQSVWLKLEPFCCCPEPLQSRAEARQLVKLLGELTQLLKEFPSILGKAGQPGYLVAELADQESIAIFQKLDAAQRQALHDSWQAGRELLETHARLLQDELRVRRNQSLRERLCRMLYLTVTTEPRVLLLLVVLVIANLALWMGYFQSWFLSP